MEAIVIPCTSEKIWDSDPGAGRVAAKDAYTKPAFLKWREYAESSGCPWFILSTKYGLIPPDRLIEQYNVAVSSALRDPDLLSLLERQGEDLGLRDFDQIVLLDWEKFEPLLRAAVPDPNVKCVLRKLMY